MDHHPTPDQTCFKAAWQRFAEDRRLPDPADKPFATVTFTVVELRQKIAPRFFSHGLAHAEATRRSIEKLIPPPAAFPRRLPAMPADFPPQKEP